MASEVLLRLLQISDTAFPTGAFSHSLGLEAFAEAGELKDTGDLERVVGMHLSSLATSDCVALRAAFVARGIERLVEVDRLLSATKLSKELRGASSSTGKRFLMNMQALNIKDNLLKDYSLIVKEENSPGNLAVGWGAAALPLGLGMEEATISYLYSAVSSLIAAGQKLIPLGQSIAQRMLFRLSEEIIQVVRKSKEIEVDNIYSFAPMLDVHSMLHERQRVRLYIS